MRTRTTVLARILVVAGALVATLVLSASASSAATPKHSHLNKVVNAEATWFGPAAYSLDEATWF